MALQRLLILTYHFPPSAASGTFRMLGFARYLPRYDWQTIVVAPPCLPWEPDDPELLRKVPLDTVIFPVSYRRGSLAQRLAPISVWLPKALSAARLAIREYRPDAMMTSGPPHQIHWLGLALGRRHNLPWIADFRDPWVADGRTQSRPIAGWRTRIAARMERAVFERADVMIANAPRAAEAIAEAYPTLRHKVHTLCNGFDQEEFASDRSSEAPNESIEVVHTGALYGKRDPRPFLDAVAALVREPQGLPRPLRVLLLGPEPEDKTLDLDTEIRRRGLESVVTVGGQVSYAQALAAMKRANILLLFDSPGRRIGVPAKAYEYIGAGRPILALGERDGDLAWALGESGAPHRIAAATDPAGIGRALAELCRESVSLDRMPSQGTQRLAFTREALAGRLAAILDHCTVSATSGGPRARTLREAAFTTAH